MDGFAIHYIAIMLLSHGLLHVHSFPASYVLSPSVLHKKGTLGRRKSTRVCVCSVSALFEKGPREGRQGKVEKQSCLSLLPFLEERTKRKEEGLMSIVDIFF
jgi:hypothetical protein